MKKNLTPYRREVLDRLFVASRPLSKSEALCGHPNILPTLRRFGWVQQRFKAYEGDFYVITDEGIRAIGADGQSGDR